MYINLNLYTVTFHQLYGGLQGNVVMMQKIYYGSGYDITIIELICSYFLWIADNRISIHGRTYGRSGIDNGCWHIWNGWSSFGRSSHPWNVFPICKCLGRTFTLCMQFDKRALS